MPALRLPVALESSIASVGVAPTQVVRADAAPYHDVQWSSEASPSRSLVSGLTADSLLVSGTLTLIIGAYGARWIFPSKEAQERDVAELNALLETCKRCISIVSDFFEDLPPEERNDFYVKLNISGQEQVELKEAFKRQHDAVQAYDVQARTMCMTKTGLWGVCDFVKRKHDLRRDVNNSRRAIRQILGRAEHSSSRVLEVQKKNVPNSAESDATPPVALVEAHTIDELFEAPHLPGSFYGRAEEFEIVPVAEPIIIRMDEHPGMDVGISDDEDQIPREDDMV